MGVCGGGFHTLDTIPALPSLFASFGSGPCSMGGTVIANFLRGWTVAWPLVVICVAPAAAQFAPPASVPGGASRNPTCLRLESQLASIDRGSFDPAKADHIKRL